MQDKKTGLADLKRLHRTLAAVSPPQAQPTAALVKKEEKEAPLSPEQEIEAFRRAVRSAKPIAAAPRVVHKRTPELADTPMLARRAAAIGEASVRADQGVSDGDVTHRLSENGTAFVRPDVAADTARRLRNGHWRLGAELDLHGLRVEQARHAIVTFLGECGEQGIRCVRVVHGKGHGSPDMNPVLKDKVRSWLIQTEAVLAFSDTLEKDGGSGAVVVLLAEEGRLRR
jgi:DNA-nicking Smr family endonuclease